jgi:hypothetical protein
MLIANVATHIPSGSLGSPTNSGRPTSAPSTGPTAPKAATPSQPLLDPQMLAWRREGSWRPPDWRHRVAVCFLDRSRPLKPFFEDEGVAETLEFLKALRQCRDDSDRQRLREQMPSLFGAHSLYVSEPPTRRAILEGWILSGTPLAAIADKTRLALPIIAAYARQWFDVLEGLTAESWVAHQVLRLHSSPEPTLDHVLRLYAYVGGPLALERLLEVFLGPAWASAPTLRPRLENDLETLRVRVAVATVLMPLSPESGLALLRSSVHLRHLELATDVAAVSKHLQAALDCTRVGFGAAAVQRDEFLGVLFGDV